MALKKLWMRKLQKYFEFQSKFIVYFLFGIYGARVSGGRHPKNSFRRIGGFRPFPKKMEVMGAIEKFTLTGCFHLPHGSCILPFCLSNGLLVMPGFVFVNLVVYLVKRGVQRH